MSLLLIIPYSPCQTALDPASKVEVLALLFLAVSWNCEPTIRICYKSERDSDPGLLLSNNQHALVYYPYVRAIVK